MRILFINAPLWNETRSLTGEAMGGLAYFPPLGMLYLSSYLKEKCLVDVETSLFDYSFVEENNYAAIDETLNSFEPDIVGLTTYTFILYDIFKICRHIKKLRPGCTIVLGGKHVEIYAEETARQPFVDYCVMGEGEVAFAKLVEELSRKNTAPDIKGLWYSKSDGTVARGGMAERIDDLDALPLPDISLVQKKGYHYTFNSGVPEGIMSTSRGCPYTCHYCMSAYSDRVFKGRSAESVVQEMQAWAFHGFQHINFFDDTFNANLKRAKRICQLLIEKKLPVRFSFRGTPACIDEEFAGLLAEAGCERAILGVESANSETLLRFGRKSQVDQVKKAYELLDQAGIATAGFFILGFPGETRQMAQRTINLACELKLDYAQFTVLFPAPGTPYYATLRNEKGIDDFWRDFAQAPPREFHLPYYSDLISETEIKKLARKAYRQFYFRPKTISRHLKKLTTWSELRAKTSMALKLLFYSLRRRRLQKADFLLEQPAARAAQ